MLNTLSHILCRENIIDFVTEPSTLHHVDKFSQYFSKYLIL